MISYENYMRMHGLHGLGTVAARQMAQAKDELVQKRRAEMANVLQSSNDIRRSSMPIPAGEQQTPVGLDWTGPQRRTLDQAQYHAEPPADVITSGLQGFRGRQGRSRGAGQVVSAGDRVCLALRVTQQHEQFRNLVEEAGGTVAGKQGDVFLIEVQVTREYTQTALVEAARQVADHMDQQLEANVEYVNVEAGTCGAEPADSGGGGGGSTSPDSGGETTTQPSNGGAANGDQAAFGGCGWLCPIVGLSAFAGGFLLLRFASK